MADVIELQTGQWERDQRMFLYAVGQLEAYVARRAAKGEKVRVVRPAYRVGQIRATLEVNGEPLRMLFLPERGAWRAA